MKNLQSHRIHCNTLMCDFPLIFTFTDLRKNKLYKSQILKQNCTGVNRSWIGWRGEKICKQQVRLLCFGSLFATRRASLRGCTECNIYAKGICKRDMSIQLHNCKHISPDLYREQVVYELNFFSLNRIEKVKC